ncbi:hypothetical protein QYM36_014976 [Artemia franciscana]|uniref:Chitin-binding type-2 domain-containing protein n=1 Tax=Artemia franciscana TaxID=6661 RepID=A0AA88HDM8_ARTSF|nr:hypothetical protein QYM36_014976 [Artemia franciscana]
MWQLIEKTREFKQKAYVAFVDFKAAFDFVDRQSLLFILKTTGLPAKYCNLFERLHEGTESCVKVNGRRSSSFEINTGVQCGTNPEEPPTTEGQLETTIEESDESTSSEAETEDTGVETTQLPTTETDPEGSGSVESICPEVDGDYALHIPHESDCTMFYKCDRGTPELKVCPHNLWFNAALQVCDWPAQSGCEM